jgi:hypothetical protein
MAKIASKEKSIKPPKPQAKPEKIADADFENEQDQSDNDDPLQNKLFDLWEGRVVARNTGKKDHRDKVIYDKKFEPLIKRKSGVKITQSEADILNAGAQNAPRQDYVLAYLPADTGETGKKVKLVEEEPEVTPEAED